MSDARPERAEPRGLESLGLAVDYGRGPVLDGVDLRFEPGEFVGLLGRNGSGKTTLLRALLGLVPEARGGVLVDGVPLDDHLREAEQVFSSPAPEVNAATC